MAWTAVADAEGHHDVELYKDGELIYESGWNIGIYSLEAELQFSRYINESGVYKFRVRSGIDYYTTDDTNNSDTHTESDWVESPEITYTKPSSSLGSTVAYWDEGQPGVYHYNSVAGAGGYLTEVYFTKDGETEERVIGSSWYCSVGFENEAGVVRTDDITWRIEDRGAGKYRVKIQALSGNLDKYANGVLGEFSAYYDSTQTADAVGNAIADAMANGTPTEALEAIKNDVSVDAMKIAMQTDANVLGQVKDLEEKYIAEKNIEVKTPTVSSEAASYVDSSKISMVGAGLNVDAGAVQLEVGVPAKKEYVNTKHYQNTVQLAIELKHDNTSVHELQVPITITMPIPAGLNASRLAILHYHEDGTFESVNLKNNDDGTVTFTVTSFSTFVFAEETSGSGSWDDAPDYYDDGDDDNSVTYDWSDFAVDVDWNDVNSRLDAAISAANGQNVNVLTGKDMKVSTDILNKIAGKNVTLGLQLGNGVTISVSGQNNKSVKGDINLTVTGLDTIPEAVKNQALSGALISRPINITENSALKAKTNIHVGLGAEYVGKYANLYYYDTQSNQVRLVGVFVINADGQSMFSLSRGGQYLVTVTDGMPSATPISGYTVVAGDTLSGIAARLGISVSALKAANPQIADVNMIHPGDVINVK